MRQGTTVNYLSGDHLGSTSLVTDAGGARGRRPGASKVFQVSPEVWNSLTPAQQWALNKDFLDQAVAQGDYFFG